ncbi:MAG: NADPH-dependent assimilatory sulfite reductase hemoprotein subunit [Candidatus Melainabacteria bacterium]|nr:NADPH-dependent assimilatory sulfite reductase hemoprotein subunit [Candidatus Melainabacteria bacterium]MBI3307792.1 NADPH-dependent assimilatory sulfite reductase hemoprotein subunit [Candidatus Melainabacteria bacterium]
MTKDESIKEKSNYLRGSIKEELSQNTAKFNPEDSKLLKFHGVYEQDNRDSRQERIAKKQEKEYIFMIRTKLPGGMLTSDQYIELDDISNTYTNKTLRITTRQTIQFHGIIKGNLHKTLNEINKKLITTYGGCGDVVRNVMAPPIADIDPSYPCDLIKIATEISNYFLPKSKAYFEIWVDDEKVDLASEAEPIYGKTYLPRKFKIAIGTEDDNSVDLFTQDVGLIAIVKSGKLTGFDVLVGGGLGHNHNKPETYPRLASMLGFVKLENLITILETIVTTQRDFGGRENRKHARMKYLIDDNGLEWFKKEVEKRSKIKLEKKVSNGNFKIKDYLGWHKQKDGNWYLGIFIENGRISDQSKRKTKSGLREIITRFKSNVRFTPQQNIILTDIKEDDKANIDKLLEKYNFFMPSKNLSNLRRNSMACVALPTCGLALAESERALPGILDKLEEMGHGDIEVSLRMSGCPNSCSRPPVSEIGIIGTSANKYNLYLGGAFEGNRLNIKIKDNVEGETLAIEIGNIIDKYKKERKANEKLGDFYQRIGI